MNQVDAVVLPLPVALALAVLVLVLLAVTAAAIALRKPARVRPPDWVHGRESRPAYLDEDEEAARRLGHLLIDELDEPQGRARREPTER